MKRDFKSSAAGGSSYGQPSQASNFSATSSAASTSIAYMTKTFVPKFIFGNEGANKKGQEVFQTRFSPDGQFLAASLGDGTIKVYNISTGKIAYTLLDEGQTMPTTSLRFRPASAVSSTKNVLAAGTANGKIIHWHVTSGKKMSEMIEEDNQVFALDFNEDGSKLASGGQDSIVRVYDEQTKGCIRQLSGGSGKSAAIGHSSRVFAVKWVDANTVLTGGWDDVVFLWDIRQDIAVRAMFGPHIAGDAIDVYRNQILTAAWRPENPLQLWDLGTGNLIQDIPFPNQQGNACLLYTCQFSKDSQAARIIAGGSGNNEARVYERESETPTIIGSIKGMNKGVFSCDFHPTINLVAVASGDGSVRVIEYP